MSGDRTFPRRLAGQLKSGKMDRREVLAILGGLGVSATAGSSWLTRAQAQEGPKPGGHLRFAMAHGEAQDTLDPAHVNNGYTTVVAYAITNMLTEVGADGSLQPKLSESWEASEGATKWTFTLRKGVEFHNGKSFTAKDVIASINHHRGEKSTSSVKPIVAPIESITADGDHVVVIKLKSGDADIPFKLSTFSFGMYPGKDDGSIDWQSGIGTGAYTLKSFRPGERTQLEKNRNFWQAGRGHFDSGELLSIQDTAARQNALLTNEVDGIDRLDLKTVERLRQTAGIKVEEVRGKLHYTFPMLTNVAPFTDNNVRLALKHAIDREALLKTILFGHGTVGNDHLLMPAYPFFAADIEQRTYDPDKAKYYLKQAGMTSLAVDLSAANAAFTGAVDTAVLYESQARKANISINVVQEPNDGYWSNVWQKKPWCAAYWFGTPTADDILTQAFSAGASWNDSAWNNPQFNKILVEARSELDNGKRAGMYRDLQLLVRDEGGVVIPLFANDVFATSTRIKHDKLADNYECDGRMFFDRWWFG